MTSHKPQIPLQPGDVLLFRRKRTLNFIPRMISIIQGNTHVHVAVVVQVNPPLVAEADTEYGTRITMYEICTLIA